MNAPSVPISIIVAVDRKGAIGMNNQMPWHISADSRWFKKHTTGHTVVMGRRTWASLPVKPLPGRKNVVITHEPGDCYPQTVCVGSVEMALEQMDTEGENFVIGGGNIYRQFLPFAQKVYLTMVDSEYDADTWFPALDPGEWKEIFREEHPEEDPGYIFLILERIN